MLILALDTATDTGSLALAADEGVVREVSLPAAGAYLSRLLPRLAALFAEAPWDPADLAAIGVSVGPGNFTGLRIGCAIAKTLAWSLGCPLVAVPTLEALAAQVPWQPLPVGVVMDAKRNEVFFGLYRGPGDLLQVMAEPVRLPMSELPARLAPPLVLTGPLAGSLPFAPPQGVTLAAPEVRQPRAATVARLARRRVEAGLTVPPQQLAPLYLRPAL